MVTKLVTELNDFDNLYFEVCNEPYERGGLTKDWNDQIIAAIADAEAVLPKKHLIAQNFPPSSAAVAELNGRVSLLNFHAAKTDSVRLNYSFNRVIAFDETGGADRSDRKYRTEGWEWIVAGGGVYDHLDFSFTTARPDGSAVPLPLGTPGGGGPALRRQLRILKEFIESFEFVRMKPDNTTIKRNHITLPQAGGSRVSSNATVRALSEAGRTYAIYVKGGNQAELLLELPAATYKAEWIDTKTGRSGKSETFNHAGGNKSFVSPEYLSVRWRVAAWTMNLVPAGRSSVVAVTGKTRPARSHIAVTDSGSFRRNPKGVKPAVPQVKPKAERLVRQRGQIVNPLPTDRLQRFVGRHRNAILCGEPRHNLSHLVQNLDSQFALRVVQIDEQMFSTEAHWPRRQCTSRFLRLHRGEPVAS